MEVIELEALNEGAIEQASHRRTGCLVPTDDRSIAFAFEAQDGFHGSLRPRQMRAHDGAADSVEEQILGPLLDPRRNGIELEALQPQRQLSGWTCSVGRRLPGPCHCHGSVPSPWAIIAD
jgi:hypothetical protein